MVAVIPSEPTNWTTPPRRFVPTMVAFTVVPGLAPMGEIAVTVGGKRDRTMKGLLSEIEDVSGLRTEIAKDAEVARMDAGMTAVSVVELTKLVVIGIPLIRTDELGTKPAPLKVIIVSPAPAPTLRGVIEFR